MEGSEKSWDLGVDRLWGKKSEHLRDDDECFIEEIMLLICEQN